MKKSIISRNNPKLYMTYNIQPVLCLGSFHWDEVALSRNLLAKGDDSPGMIHKNPGGVSFNLAKTMTEFGIPVILGSVLGNDTEGHELLGIAQGLGINCELVCTASQKTDKYIAIEDSGGLVAAIADCSSLEMNEKMLLETLKEWKKSKGSKTEISELVIDSNLSSSFIDTLLNNREFNNYPINIASASNHKIERIKQLDYKMNSTLLYLNFQEARKLLATDSDDCHERQNYIQVLLQKFGRVILTDGENEIIDADSREIFKFKPQSIRPNKITGAGDYFMAAHKALELLGYSRMAALEKACDFVQNKIT